MKPSAGSKKRLVLLIFLIPVACLLVAAGTLEFLIHYRFKESIGYLVTRESKGQYAFHASEASISLWRGTVLVKGSQLSCLDTAGGRLWCRMNTPEIYFSVSSWKTLLFDKKLVIDSIAIRDAAIEVHAGTASSKASEPFPVSELMEGLKKTLLHLNVHAFSLKDVSFTWQGAAGTDPLQFQHIDLAVSNFSRLGHDDSHIMGSDNFSIALGREHWVLGAGRQHIDFARLSFDSKGHRFALDSFSLRQQPDTGKGEFRLTTDRFFFNSNRLPAVYERNGQLQVLLDTLVCINPVLSIPGIPQKQQQDPMGNVIRETMYRRINVRFVQVIDGRLLVRNKADRPDNASTRKANLRIYNLTVDPYGPRPLTSDSIRVNFSNIEFLTLDSTYKLSIGDFAIRGNDALFSGVHFGPARPNQKKSVDYTAPLLRLQDIDVPELLRKHIKATRAELLEPRITMIDNRQEPTTTITRGKLVEAKKLALFYRTLHNIRELIDAPEFIISGGAVSYVHGGTMRCAAQITGLNAHILLNKFFVSDSLPDIKQAIPEWRIEKLDFDAAGWHLLVEKYGFKGLDRQSSGAGFRIFTDKGWQIQGKNIFWNVLDWGRLQKAGEIKIDSLHLGELIFETPPGDSSHAPAKPLPFIAVRTLDIDTLTLDRITTAGRLHVSGDHARLEGLRSGAHALTWDHARIDLHNLDWRNRLTTIRIASAVFDNNAGLKARNIRITSSRPGADIVLSIPGLVCQLPLHSSDLSLFPSASLSMDEAAFSFSRLLKKDTLSLSATLKVELKNCTVFPSLTANALLSWKNLQLHDHSDSNKLDITGITGAFHDAAFTQASWKETRPQTWLDKIAVDHAALQYTTPNLAATAAGCSWDPGRHTLRIAGFQVLPRITREESFKKARWQQDFVTVRGRALTLSNTRIAGDLKHRSLDVDKLILDGVDVQASRDKHLPFRHGVEKPMPTKLLTGLPLSIRVDTVFLVNDKVTYDELSASTARWSSITVGAINGYIRDLKTRADPKDTLTLDASARMFDGYIRRFRYEESYGDSLSAFTARTAFAAIDLKKISAVSVPAAGVSITDGYVDTAWSFWQGNRYASYGNMNFYFNKLRIKILNKKDSIRRGFVPELETWAARILLPADNKRTSAIYFERDREKFVFNYWVKTQTSGILSTLIREKDRAYRKRYKLLAPHYSLPPGGLTTY
jgi:hypothetical protein